MNCDGKFCIITNPTGTVKLILYNEPNMICDGKYHIANTAGIVMLNII